MMDPEDSKVRLEVLRKIKFYKDKKTKIPNFVRKKRIEILNRRAEVERKMLLNQRSQESIGESKQVNKDPVNINTTNKTCNDLTSD